MNQSNPLGDADSTGKAISLNDVGAQVKSIVIQQVPASGWRTWLIIMLLLGLAVSMVFNLLQLAVLGAMAADGYSSDPDAPMEKFHSGEPAASAKIARIEVGFTIMPPYTDRLLKAIEKARDDDSVRGVLLVVNSPGGLVSDSHQIYHELKLLSDKKPVYVSFKGIAASGGYYIAMGAGPGGKIFAEPTTWTGSIGVIIPRYDLSELATKVGVASDSLKTGPFKDALNPLQELGPDERQVWEAILDDSFGRFIQVIDEGRANLDEAAIRKLATGQVYTADQALANGLVDAIGYEREVLADLQAKLSLQQVQVIEYEFPQTLADILLGGSVAMRTPSADPLTKLLESSVPRAMYLFGPHTILSAPQSLR